MLDFADDALSVADDILVVPVAIEVPVVPMAELARVDVVKGALTRVDDDATVERKAEMLCDLAVETLKVEDGAEAVPVLEPWA